MLRRFFVLFAVLLVFASGASAQTAVNITPTPIQRFVDNNGNALVGGKLFVYQAGTTTKATTYTDSTGATPQTNPIILNARGEPQNMSGISLGVWLPPNLSYKFVLAPSTDTDPPTNPYWTIDNVPSGASAATPVLTVVANNAALKALSSTAASFFLRMSFATAGDAPPLFYRSTSGACTVAAGAGDNGSQVELADNNCANAIFPTSGIDIRQFGVTTSAAANTTTPLVQAAVDAAYNLGTPATVAMPIGFNFNSIATYPGIKWLCGGGNNVLHRKQAGPGVYLSDQPGHTYAQAVVNKPELEDCTIEGGSFDGTNIMLDATESWRLTNVNSTNTGATGAQFVGSVTAGVLTVYSNLLTANLTGGGPSSGAGYAINDTITLAGGTFIRAATITVDNVDGGGGILSWHISDPGVYTVTASSLTQGSTSGSGTGATFGSALWGINNGVVHIGQMLLCDGCRIAGTNTYPTVSGLGTGTGGPGTYTLSSPISVSSPPMVTVSTWTWTDVGGSHTLPSANVTFVGSGSEAAGTTGVFDGQWLGGFVGGTYTDHHDDCSTFSTIGIYADSMNTDGGNKFNQNIIQNIYLPCAYLGVFLPNGADSVFEGIDFEYNTIGILAGTGSGNATRNVFRQLYFEGLRSAPMWAGAILAPFASSTTIDGVGSLSFVVTPLIQNAANTVMKLGNFATYNSSAIVNTFYDQANYLNLPHANLTESYFLSGDNGNNVEIGALAWGGGSVADISCGLARGTNGAPADVQSDDELCRHGSFGQYDSTPGHYHIGGHLSFFAGTNWNSGNAESYAELFTVHSGATSTSLAWKWFSSGGMASPGNTDPGAGGINAADVQINGASIAPYPLAQTAAIGGGALAAGQCTSGTATITGGGVSGTHVAVASPVSNPLADSSHGLSVFAYFSGFDTVTVQVCAIVSTTPPATVYNVWAH